MEDVSPIEDLMREHGILNRIMLIYEEIIYRIENCIDFDITIIYNSAMLVKKFIEEYHEQLEEKYIFPHFLKLNIHVALVNELLLQHKISRVLTKKILEYSQNGDVHKILEYIKTFIYMYRAHESREDTVIFNDFRKIVPKKTLEEYAELFEDTEHELFGTEGYQGILKKVMNMEMQLGIYDLKAYTPI